jgi:hypothetical protein
MPKTKIEPSDDLAHEIAVQCLMGTESTLIQGLGISKTIVMQAAAQGLGVMATNPDGTDNLEWLFDTMRAAHKQTREVYRAHPELTDEEFSAQTRHAQVEGEANGEDQNIGFDILTEAIQKMGARGITKNEVLPSLVDFTASVVIALGGEDAVKACIIRMGDRIRDFNEGTFPVGKG